MQKDGKYTDATMKLVISHSMRRPPMIMLPRRSRQRRTLQTIYGLYLHHLTAAKQSLHSLQVVVSTLLRALQRTWTIDTTNVKGLAIFAEHVPVEFERDTHFEIGTVDIECGCSPLEARPRPRPRR